MNHQGFTQNSRRSLVSSNSFASNFIHLRNPWITAWWSAAFPGYGHIMLCKNFVGILLITWEIFINSAAGINQAIYYSFIGHFDMAMETINVRWLLVYVSAYVFAIWDSYKRTTELNQLYTLAYREGYSISPFKLSVMEVNCLDKREPWIAVLWSAFTPGLGHLYINNIIMALFSFIWWLIIIYFSNFVDGLFLSMLGRFEEAKAIINPQWLLFLPSFYGFTMYYTYVQAVELNKLFELEQSRFLKKTYQHKQFKMPL